MTHQDDQDDRPLFKRLLRLAAKFIPGKRSFRSRTRMTWKRNPGYRHGACSRRRGRVEAEVRELWPQVYAFQTALAGALPPRDLRYRLNYWRHALSLVGPERGWFVPAKRSTPPGEWTQGQFIIAKDGLPLARAWLWCAERFLGVVRLIRMGTRLGRRTTSTAPTTADSPERGSQEPQPGPSRGGGGWREAHQRAEQAVLAAHKARTTT